MPAPTGHSRWATASRTLPAAVALAAAYLVDAGQGNPSEITAAVLSGMLAAGVWAAVRAASPVPGDLPRRWPAALAGRLRSAPLEILLDGAAFLRAAADRISGGGTGPCGRLIEQPLPRRSGDSGAGDRALVTFGASVTPDGYVAAEDRHRHRLVIHRLVRMGADRADPAGGSGTAKSRTGKAQAGKSRAGSAGAKPRDGKPRNGKAGP